MTRRQKKKLLSLLLAVVLAGFSFYLNKRQLPPTVLGTASPGYYRVTDFADGDTFSVDMNGKTERIRLIGVDTPETHDPRKAVQCFGQAASDFTKNLIGNQPVRLASDDLSTNRDRYDRLLRYVYLPDGRLVEEEIIKQGYGFAYTSFPFTKSDHFKQLETEAREQKRGLWASCTPSLNEHGTYTANPAGQ
jgi:micrococcal nuclease